MPYSDDLYSAWDGDESDTESIGRGLNQPGPQESETPFQRPQQGFHSAALQDGGAPGTGDYGDVDVDDDVLSPTDGYFRTAQTTSSSPNTRVTAASSHVPQVPNIWVQDPSLPQGSTAESKAREAREERLGNRDRSADSQSYVASRSGPSPALQDPRSTGDTYHQPSSSSYNTNRLTTASYTPYAPQRVAYDERSFFLPREAPPAYTPSPTSSSTSPVTGDSPRNYRTFFPITQAAAGMGAQEESQGLLANEPQSMGNPNDVVDGSDSWREWATGRLRHRYGGKVKLVLIGFILLLLTVGFLIAGISSATSLPNNRPSNSPPKEPVTKNPSPNDPPGNGNSPGETDPPMEYPDLDSTLRWASDLCKNTKISRDTQHFDISFAADKKLAIIQDVAEEPHRHNINVQGSVVFRRTGSDTPGPSAVVEVVVNDDRIDISTNYDANEQSLVVTVPRGIAWSEVNSWPCVSIKITVWVPEDGTLDSLRVGTVHLGISLLDNLSIKISERAKFSSIVGPIIAASTGSDARDDTVFDVGAPDSFKFQSRFIEAETTSASIRGSWPLYDYLALQSTSGNIKVCIEPKDADKDAPRPAILYIKSLSGNVDFREPVHAAEEAFALSRRLAQEQAGYETALRAETVLPPRDYRVDVHTASGNIRGCAAFSSTCALKTTSGRIAVELLPVLDSSLSEDGSKEVLLQTSSTSGTNDITVLGPLWVDAAAGRYVNLPALPPRPTQPSKPDQDRYIPISGGDPYKMLPGRTQSTAASPSKEERNAATARALRNVHSQHGTTSARIQLRYPAVWEGDVVLGATSGKLSARGEGLRIIKREDQPWRKHLVAKKGPDGGGKISAEAISGNVDLVIGE